MNNITQDAAQSAAQQAGDVFSRKASGLTRVVSPITALAYSFVAPNITQASFYLLWAVTLYQGAYMQGSIMFMLTLIPFAAIYVYFSSAMPRSGGEYIYISRVLTPFLGFHCLLDADHCRPQLARKQYELCHQLGLRPYLDAVWAGV